MSISTFSVRQRAVEIAFFVGVAALLFISVPAFAMAATSGPSAGSTFTSVTSGTNSVAWTTPANAQVSDANYTTAVLSGSLGSTETSQYLQATGFGFAIPSDATINGIQVSVTKKSSAASDIKDSHVYLLKGGVLTTTDKKNATAWGTSDAVTTYGSTSDLWGTTWTPAQINASNFGFALSGVNVDLISSRTASVNYITVTITYTAAGASVPAVAISPSTLPAGTVSTAYNQTLTASTSATGPYTWSLASGSLPAGLSLNTAATGLTTTISGTPTASSTSIFSVKVTNGTSSTTQAYTLNVGPASAPACSPVAGNLILNPCFNDGAGNAATSWVNDSFGTNNAAFTISSDAHSGTRAAQISVTTYTDGDAKWLQGTSIAVSGGQYYTFSDYYKSSTSTEIDVIFTTGTGDDFQQLMLLPPQAGWTLAQQGFLVPSGATAMRIGHILTGTGTLTTDDYSLVVGAPGPLYPQGIVTLTFDDGWKSFITNGVPVLNAHGLKATAYLNTQPIQGSFAEYMTETDVRALSNQKFDIGGHTATHVDITQPGVNFANEINANRTYLQGLATTTGQLSSFAYPYGAFNDTVIPALGTGAGNAGYTSARTVDEGFNFTDANKYKLKIEHVTNLTTPAQIQSWITTASTTKTWLILMYHEVVTNYPADCKGGGEGTTLDLTECSTAANLNTIAAYLESNHTCVQTMAQVIAGTACPTLNVAPVLAPIGNKSVNASSTLTFTATSTDANAGDTLTYTASLPVGAAFNAATRTFSWTPTAAQLGATTTSVTVSDGHGGTDFELVTITVTQAGAITLSNLTQTFDGTPKQVTVTTNPPGLTTSVTYNGSATAPSASGSYNVEAAITQAGYTGTTTGTFLIVDPANGSPVAQNQNVSVNQNGTVAIGLVATDNGPLTWTVGTPSHGNLSGTAPTTTYTPTSGYYGSDSFTFKVNDGNTDSNTATVSITVNPIPTCPAGYTLNGATCNSPATTTPSCSSGYTVATGTGMCNATNASTTPQSVSACPTNFTYDSGSNSCVPPPASPSCPSGYHVDGTTCAVDVVVTPPPSSGGGGNNGGGGGGGGSSDSSYSIKVNGGDAKTSSRNVTVVLHRASTKAIRVWLSNDAAFSAGDWQTYDSNKAFTLTAGAGVKTVYVRFGDVSSHILSTKNDTIELTTAGGEVLGTSTQSTPGGSTGSGSSGLTPAQIASILGLLRSFGAEQSVIDKVTASLNGQVLPGIPSAGGVSTGFMFTQTLMLGSTGNEVTQLQKRLTTEGVYSGPVTGYFGPLTKAAVAAYQLRNGLPSVGVVGPMTRAKLNAH